MSLIVISIVRLVLRSEMEAEHNAAAQSVKDRRLQIRTLSGKIDQFRNNIEEAVREPMLDRLDVLLIVAHTGG